MAIVLVSREIPSQYRAIAREEYQMESAADAAILPVSAPVGSTAYTEDGEHAYIMRINGTWGEVLP